MLKKGFIISPIGESGSAERAHADRMYTKIFLPISKELDLQLLRADLDTSNSIIIKDIFNQIKEADVIIVDLYKNNPNVMYEIGLAHTLGKSPICINPNNNKIPFDIQSYRIIPYDESVIDSTTPEGEISTLKSALSSAVSNAISNPAELRLRFFDEINANSVESIIQSFMEKNASALDDVARGMASITQRFVEINDADYIKAYYIDGENNAFKALTDATNRAKTSVRSTRFSPFTVVNRQEEFFQAIQNATAGNSSRMPVNNFYRIITVNAKEKLREVAQLLTHNAGRNFTLFLTEVEYGFEMVIIDEKEVFIHFRREDETDKLITSTLHMAQPSVAREFAKIFDDLSKKSRLEVFECKNLTDETVYEAIANAREIFNKVFDKDNP